MKRLIELIKQVKTTFNLYFIVLIFILLFLLLLAFIYNDKKVYLLLFLILTLATINSYFARLNLFDLKLSTLHKSRLFRDTTSKLYFKLENNGDTSSYAINLNGEKIDKLASKEYKEIFTNFTPKKRGEVLVSKQMLESAFPLPHLKASKEFENLGFVLVYPKPKGKNLEDSFSLNALMKNGNDEFESIRPYIEGEPLSRIHWSSFAKQEKLMSKNFLEESPNDTLQLDYEKAGKNHEERLSQLCLWILQCEQRNLSFSLILNNESINSNKQSIDDMLKRLAYA